MRLGVDEAHTLDGMMTDYDVTDADFSTDVVQGAGKIYHVNHHFTREKAEVPFFFISNLNFYSLFFPAFLPTDIL